METTYFSGSTAVFGPKIGIDIFFGVLRKDLIFNICLQIGRIHVHDNIYVSVNEKTPESGMATSSLRGLERSLTAVPPKNYIAAVVNKELT